MSEINRLNHTGDAIAMPTMAPTHTSGQRFQQLIAQTPQENNNPWGKAAEQLKNTQYTDTTGTPQAYVNNGTLTAAGKSRIETAQEQLRHTTGATEVSIEQGAKQLLIEALTTQYANENNPALLQRAQQLQTELYSELTSTPSAAPQDANTEPTTANLEPYLENQLQQLGLSRTEFEASTVDLGNGDVPVSVLLATETSPRGQLQLLISIAAQQLRAQQVVAAQVPAAEPPAPPVVEPIEAELPEKFYGRDLYELKVEEGGTAKELINSLYLSLANRNGRGHTYHLQFLDEKGQVIPIAPTVNMIAPTTPENREQLNARLNGMSRLFGQPSDQMSIYWHGAMTEGGTSYQIGGYATSHEQGTMHNPESLITKDTAVDLPLVRVYLDSGVEQMRIDRIPFTSLRLSQGGNQLYNLPTQADVDAARTILAAPEQLTLGQLLKYTSPALARVDQSLYAAVTAAMAPENIAVILNNAFANDLTKEDVANTYDQLISDIDQNRLVFNDVMNVSLKLIPALNKARSDHDNRVNIEDVRSQLTAKVGDRDFSDLDVTAQGFVDLKNYNLSGLDLSGIRLENVDLSNANLTRTNLQNSSLIRSRLFGATLEEANLQGAVIDTVNLQLSDMQGANLKGAQITHLNLQESNLNNANLSGLDLTDTILLDAILQRADLTGANLYGAALTGVNLRGADLGNANLELATLSKVDLTNAQLSGVNMQGAVIGSDIAVDIETINSHPYLKQTLTPQFDIEARFSVDTIAKVSSYEELQGLRDLVMQEYQQQSALDKRRIENELLPRLRGRESELLMLGVSPNGIKLSNLDLAHQDLTTIQLNGAQFEASDFSYVNLQNQSLEGVRLESGSVLDGANLNGAQLADAILSDISVVGIQLRGANLQGAVLSDLELVRGDLVGADVSGATLRDIDLTGADISGLQYDENTQWLRVRLTPEQAKGLGLRLESWFLAQASAPPGTEFVINGVGLQPELSQILANPRRQSKVSQAMADVVNPSISHARTRAPASGYDFEEWNISGADLSESHLKNSNFWNTTLIAVNFENSNLEFGNFGQADLSAANLKSASIRHGHFQAANLTSAALINVDARNGYFQEAQLVNSNLTGADLSAANLVNANLQDANLSQADLRSANAAGANFKGADLNGVDLRQTNLSNIQHDQTTQWHGAQLRAEQRDVLGLEAEQLRPNTTTNEGALGLDLNQSPSAPPDGNTPNSVQRGPSAPLDNSGLTALQTQQPIVNPNGLIDPNSGTQAGHQPPNNTGGAVTAVAGDAPEPEQPFQVINGEVVISGISLPELNLSQGSVQNEGSVFGVAAGLPELPEYTPTPRSDASAVSIGQVEAPAADTTSESQPASQQPGGVTIGGQLGSKGEAEKANTEMEQLLGKGSRQGVRPDLFPTPIDNRIPGFGEGVPPADVGSNDTSWGLPDEPITLPESEGFPEKDPVLEDILNPNGVGRPQFTFPPIKEGSRIPEVPAEAQAALTKALPELQGIRYAQFSQLSAADQQQVIPRTLAYQQLAPNDKTNISLIEYLDSGKTSEPQRQQLSQLNAAQTVHQAQLNTVEARTGLDSSSLELINARINALQANTAQINQQTQSIQQSNAARLSTLATQAQADPVGVAFIKPESTPQGTSESRPEIKAPISQNSAPIPRFMVVRTENGPKLIENLANGQSQLHAYPLSADTPITRQESNGAWSGVPDVGQIGSRLFLDLLFTNGALKMLNNGGPVKTPSTAQPQPANTEPGTLQPSY